MEIEGTVREVSHECVLLMREVYKRIKKNGNRQIALGVLTDMLIEAANGTTREGVNWKISDEEIFGYTD